MMKNQYKAKRPFLPHGREWYAVGGLIIFLIGIVVYMQTAIMNNEDALQAELASAGSGSMRNPAPAFPMESISIPKDEIFHGGPPKDGIPSITDPKMIAANEAEYLKPDDRVVGVEFDGQAKAYPLRILVSHEAVNDSIGDIHFVVTYCPLCESVTVFDREGEDGEVLEFGISGLLYNSNVLMYDRQQNTENESLWSQMKGKGVTGKQNQKNLEILPYKLIAWADWKEIHPNTTVMSLNTGYSRNYDGGLYQSYFQSDQLMFPVNPQDDRLPLKARVLGVEIGGQAKAYPLDAIRKNGGELEDTLNGEIIRIALSKTNENTAYLTEFPKNAKVINSFWFAWAGFHPETKIFGHN